MITMILEIKALTCGFWVELRGFEPLTPFDANGVRSSG